MEYYYLDISYSNKISKAKYLLDYHKFYFLTHLKKIMKIIKQKLNKKKAEIQLFISYSNKVLVFWKNRHII